MKVEGQAEETANLENNAFGGFGGEEFTWDLNDNDSENVLEKAKKTDLTEEEIKGGEKKTPKEKKYTLLFADFECFTNGVHTPFCCCCCNEKNEMKIFYGEHCMNEFLSYLV